MDHTILCQNILYVDKYLQKLNMFKETKVINSIMDKLLIEPYRLKYITELFLH